MAVAKPTQATRKYNIEELCVSFISRNRFYAVLLSKLNKMPTTHTKTAAVGFTTQGKIVLYYNEDYFNELNLAQGQAVLEHEILHVIYKHLYRLPMSSDPKDKQMNKLQNLACDMAINQYLPNLPEGAVYPETFNLPKEMFAEWYLVELKKIQQQQQQQQQSKGGKGKGSPSDQGEQGEQGDENEQGQDDGMGGHDTIDDHDMWGKAIDEQGNIKDTSECEACDVEHELDKIVRQAVKECEGDKSIGELPAGVRREIEALANPKKKHDWKKELKVFVNTVLTLSKRLSQKRVNRRFMETVDYCLPGKKKDRRPKILLARDTSGSVCNDSIQEQFLNEMINISKFCDVLVCDCDAEVHQTYTVKKVTDFRKYIGGGGTSFEPVFIEAKKLMVDGIIYLTDTEGSFPKKEEIGKFAQKTIWVTIDQDKVSVPFGKHVNIKDE